MTTVSPGSQETIVSRPKFANNPVLEQLKKAMGDKIELLESVDLRHIPIIPHDDDEQIARKTISPFKLEVGIFDDFEEEEKLRIFAYLVENTRTPHLEIAAYIYPTDTEEASEQISFTDVFRSPSVSLHDTFTSATSPPILGALIKIIFVHYGLNVQEPLQFSKSFLHDVERACRLFNKQSEEMERGQKKSAPRRTDPWLTARGYDPESSNDANVNAVLSRRIEGAVDQTSRYQRDLPASEPSTETSLDPSVLKPMHFSIAQLQQDFTRPLEAAQADEKRHNDRIIFMKQRLQRKREEIAKMRNDIVQTERSISQLHDEIASSERQRDRSVAMQGQLVDSLHPDLKDFMRIGRTIHLPEAGEPSSKRQRRS